MTALVVALVSAVLFAVGLNVGFAGLDGWSDRFDFAGSFLVGLVGLVVIAASGTCCFVLILGSGHSAPHLAPHQWLALGLVAAVDVLTAWGSWIWRNRRVHRAALNPYGQ